MINNPNETLQTQTDDAEEVTGLAAHYPIYLNNEQYDYFKTWEIKRNDYVTTHETESGKQEDVTTRKGRKTIGVFVKCFQPLLSKIIALADLDEFEVKYYDPATNNYVTITARIGANSMSYALKEKTAKLNTVNGVWQVSFTLEEF